jgi:tetratricopeptide (TPR) repeat protein
MYLDVMAERVQPRDWKIRIDGLELFEPYIQAHQRALYDHIYIADIREAARVLDCYDLIIAGDVIEHLDKDDGKTVVRLLYEKAQKALLVNIPLGGGWEHGEVHGNPGERHRSQWECEDFLAYPNHFQEFRAPFGARYGVFYCPKDCPKEQRVEGLCQAAILSLSRGGVEEAAIHLTDAHALAPENAEIAGQLADLMLKQQKIDHAVAALERCAEANPQFHYGKLAAARILSAVRRYSEAESRLESLLLLNDLEPNLRDQVRQHLDEIRRRGSNNLA